MKNVDLSHFHNDMERWEHERPDKERELYDAACAGHGGAAAELQFWQAKFGSLEAKDIEEALREGQLLEQLRLLGIATTPNQRHGMEWHQLQAFGVAERKTGPKSAAKLLELRHAYGITLTAADLRAALTTNFDVTTKKKEKPKLPREDWQKTLGEVEDELIAYVCRRFKGASEENAKAYVRDSFPNLPWDKPDEQVEYPPHW